jgi:hypothetical protein
MTRPSESFEEKRPDESNTEARVTPPSESMLFWYPLVALLGSVIILYSIFTAVFTGYVLSIYIFSWLETGVFGGELPADDLIAFFCISFPVGYFGYRLARCWPLVAFNGAATFLILSGLGIIPGLLKWTVLGQLLKCTLGVILFIFAYYKRDALGLLKEKRPDESNT